MMEVIRVYESAEGGEAPKEVLVSFLEREMPWGLEWEIVAERGYEGLSFRKSLARHQASAEDRHAIRDHLKDEMKRTLLQIGWIMEVQT